MRQNMFVLDDELTIEDKNAETITGYLWATSGLMTKLKAQLMESGKQEGVLPVSVIDNPNFYATYDVKNGHVSISSSFWTQVAAHDKIVEQHCSCDLSLSREEETTLIHALETYCKTIYGKTCTQFLEEIRKNDISAQNKGFLLEKAAESLHHPSFNTLVQSAQARAAASVMNPDNELSHSDSMTHE